MYIKSDIVLLELTCPGYTSQQKLFLIIYFCEVKRTETRRCHFSDNGSFGSLRVDNDLMACNQSISYNDLIVFLFF